MRPKLFKVPSKCLLISRVCWFDLVRNMWGFLATYHASSTDIENLANKPSFCLVLLAKLVDLLIKVYTIPIILGILIPFTPRNMAPHWERWWIVKKNKLYLNLMYFELPRKLDVLSLQRQMLPCWPDLLVHAVRTAMM